MASIKKRQEEYKTSLFKKTAVTQYNKESNKQRVVATVTTELNIQERTMTLTQRITEVLRQRAIMKKRREQEQRENVVQRIDDLQQRKAKPMVFPLP